MKNKVLIRRLDKLGRITIPANLRKSLNINDLEELEKIYGYDYEYIELNILKGLCITRNNYK